MTSTNDKENLPRLLTMKEASEYLWNKSGKTCTTRLKRAMEKGTIKSVRFSNSSRHWFPLTSLQEFVGEKQDD